MRPKISRKFNPFTICPGVWSKSYYLTLTLSTAIAGLRLEEHYSETGIGLREVWILMACEESAASQSVIADCLGINRNVMVTIIDNMESKGLLRRVRNPENRREYILRLKTKGRIRLREIEQNFENVAAKVFHPIPLEEIRRIRDNAMLIIRSYYEGTM